MATKKFSAESHHLSGTREPGALSRCEGTDPLAQRPPAAQQEWGSAQVILFTEYRATQNWLKTVLAIEGFTGGDLLLTMYGGMDPHDQEAVQAAFRTAPEISPIRILLATDAASKGLNLQNYCSRLVHLEIPWNPNRLEQRNGRIDRHGQMADDDR